MPILDLPSENFLSSQLRSFIESAPPLPLKQQSASEQTANSLQSLIQQQTFRPCAEAGLWLLARQWDQSHRISQDQHNHEGSYWHGIMHRIEGDYWNSKYWMRKTKDHPVRNLLVQTLSHSANQLLQSKQSASGSTVPDLNLLNSPESVSENLVDLVEKTIASHSKFTDLIEKICWWEWQLLFQHCISTNR